MIRFMIKVESKDKLSTLLSSVDGTHISMLVNQYGCYMMADSNELFCYRVFKFLERNGIEDAFCFRIERKKFLALLIEGMLEFRIVDNKINISFRSMENTEYYSFETIYEEDVVERYYSKLKLLDDMYNYKQIEIRSLMPLVRIARSLGTSVSCVDNVVFLRLKQLGVFINHEATNFTTSGKMLSFLQRYTDTVYNAQNYLAFKSDDTGILVTKYKSSDVNEFSFIQKQGSAFKITFILNNMITLCKTIKFNDGQFILDLEGKKAEFIEDKNIYRTDINVTDVVSAKLEKEKDKQEEGLDFESMFDNTESISLNYGIPKLIIPSAVLRNVLSNINALRSITLYVKKNFIELVIGDMHIVFARSDYK